MQCVDLEELLSAYADGQTVPAQTEFVETHLGACVRCRLVVQRHEETRQLLQRAEDDQWTPPDLRLRVAYAYRTEKRAQGHPWFAVGLLGSIVALLLVFGLLPGQALSPNASRVRDTAPVALLAQAPHTATSCGHRMPTYFLARCLGVSRQILPTILAEEANAYQPQPNAIKRPLKEWSSPKSVAHNTAKKGGGTPKVSYPRQSGLVPV